MLNDPICAISTSLSNSAISIIRMTGEGILSILKEISDINDIEANQIKYAHIKDKNTVIDEVLVSYFKGPKSYTREDIIEINCHGGVFLTRKILNLLLTKGCRLAEPGEFTKRAYLNGRIDLTKAESINDLINATSETQTKSAIKALSGSIKKLLTPIINEMKDIISMIEVNIDYPEYDDVKHITNDNIKPLLNKWIIECEEMIDKAERFRVIKDGIETVIIGKPNVGKSSLLNALIEQDKAIVTEMAGTTRDLIEGKVSLKNITLRLIDTAGIRDSSNKVEMIGIEKTKKALEKAELVILVIDSSNINDDDNKLLELTKNKNRIIVYNKSDLKKHEGISISASNNDIKELIDYLNNQYQNDAALIDEDVLNNERQISLMKKALSELEIVKDTIDNNTLDLIILNLESSFHYLSEILGNEYREELIDHIFKNFCLGK